MSKQAKKQKEKLVRDVVDMKIWRGVDKQVLDVPVSSYVGSETVKLFQRGEQLLALLVGEHGKHEAYAPVRDALVMQAEVWLFG